ncbi:MAG: 3-keto-disaccharide hydrolase [Verrucomicrobiales bacterium]
MTMKLLALALGLGTGALSAERVALFNGKDFSGWGAAGQTEHVGYVVKDGVISSTPECKNLMTDREFTDYVLEFEFKLTPGANNGLGIHYPGQGNGASEGMEIQIIDNSAEKYKGLKDYQFHGGLYTLAAAKKGHLKPVGEWNHEKVTVQGPQVTVELNGAVILEANLDELQEKHPEHKGVKRRKGRIAFLGHNDIVHFRNITIDEGVEVKDEAWYQPTGQADESLAKMGFRTLLGGAELSDWKLPEESKGHWVAKDGWIIAYDGASQAKEKNLWSKEEFGDVQIVCDWRWAGPGEPRLRPYIDRETGAKVLTADGKVKQIEVEELDSGIYLRGSSKGQVNMWNWPVGSGEVYGYRTDQKQPEAVRAGVTPKATADMPIGEWNRFVITIKGEELTVVLNGRVVIEKAQLPGLPESGPIALQHHGSKLEFANVAVKELK